MKAFHGSEYPSIHIGILKIKLISVGPKGFLDTWIDLCRSKNLLHSFKILVFVLRLRHLFHESLEKLGRKSCWSHGRSRKCGKVLLITINKNEPINIDSLSLSWFLIRLFSNRTWISEGWGANPKGRCQPIIWPKFPKNCMNMKKAGPRDILQCYSMNRMNNMDVILKRYVWMIN